MKREVVLVTNYPLCGDKAVRMRELGYRGYNYQFRIICKCASVEDANRKCQAAGLAPWIFSRNWWERGWSTFVEEKLCENEDIWICLDGTKGDKYIPISKLMEG